MNSPQMTAPLLLTGSSDVRVSYGSELELGENQHVELTIKNGSNHIFLIRFHDNTVFFIWFEGLKMIVYIFHKVLFCLTGLEIPNCNGQQRRKSTILIEVYVMLSLTMQTDSNQA